MNIISHISVAKFLLNFIVLATCFLQLLFFSIPQFPMSGKENTVDSRINHVVLKHILSSSLCLAAAAGQPCCFTRTRQTKQHLYLWTGCSLAVLSFSHNCHGRLHDIVLLREKREAFVWQMLYGTIN